MTRTAMQRWCAKVALPASPDDCWEWTGARSAGEYGEFRLGGGVRGRAHRFGYEAFVGPIPRHLVVDHLCRNRLCVNPHHLEVVTNGENVLRGVGPSAVCAKRKACSAGHSFDERNTRRKAKKGWRVCRECDRIQKASKRRMAGIITQRERFGLPPSSDRLFYRHLAPDTVRKAVKP